MHGVLAPGLTEWKLPTGCGYREYCWRYGEPGWPLCLPGRQVGQFAVTPSELLHVVAEQAKRKRKEFTNPVAQA
ncbi:hypothetical protein LMH87_003289 [Akanthomyces muscarius]|uniref:Uncharacterized protein n=1 Tax=Akanthomyces muscarius TaxID=2231603 RepID=A0A9W8UGQ8_AKAMU|nr:hypothetical protein LMH87_003289 [Akanthomyces muscarius]KAJ4144405.1 hypothetical protein LMH87_003289 [Akanthomyces muscarius]